MTCPACDNPKAYVGFVTVECPNSECRNFCESMAPKLVCLTGLDEALKRIQDHMDKFYTYTYKFPGLNGWIPKP